MTYVKINGFNILKDIRGKTFGRLTAIEPVDRNVNRKNMIRWKFICSCGKEIIRIPYDVMRVKTQSCGCLQKDEVVKAHKKPEGVAAFNATYGQYKRGAKSRKLSFDLTKNQFKYLTSQNCHYCGIEPSQSLKQNFNGEYIYNGIDRLDNSKGYIFSNCVPCCKVCNIAKRDRNDLEFIDWIRKVYFNTIELETK